MRYLNLNVHLQSGRHFVAAAMYGALMLHTSMCLSLQILALILVSIAAMGLVAESGDASKLNEKCYNSDVIMGAMASQITSITITDETLAKSQILGSFTKGAP